MSKNWTNDPEIFKQSTNDDNDDDNYDQNDQKKHTNIVIFDSNVKLKKDVFAKKILGL